MMPAALIAAGCLNLRLVAGAPACSWLALLGVAIALNTSRKVASMA